MCTIVLDFHWNIFLTSSSDNRILESESSVNKEEAMKKIEVLSLIEAARSAGLPWDYYLSQMYKRSSSVSTGGCVIIL